MLFWDDDEAFAIATIEAGNEAYGALWRARGYSAHELTDGVISRAMALTIATADTWERLAAIVDATGQPRFVELLDFGRIRLVGFERWNRAATDVMARRQKRSESGRLGGLQSGRVRRHDEAPNEASASPVASAGAQAKGAAEVNPVGTGSGIGSGSGSGPEGDARGNPPSETRLRSAPPPPPEPDRPNAETPQKPAEKSLAPPIDRTPYRPPMSDDEQAIRDELRRAPKLRDLDVCDIAAMAWTLLSSGRGGIKLAWILQSIRDANDVSELAEQRHVRHARAVKFIKASRAPKADSAAQTPRSAAYRESDDREVLEHVRARERARPRITSQPSKPVPVGDAATAAALIANLGKNMAMGAGLPPIRAPTPEEREANRQAAMRWAEEEARKAGGT